MRASFDRGVMSSNVEEEHEIMYEKARGAEFPSQGDANGSSPTLRAANLPEEK